ncbi:Hypothetical predicted protein [Olea europaea subsp. europaea]|uniref:Uncharacterized protein n=1 Tax=Olea europaea subsp. europaea TaxID=158383 RepID=A0A8S0RL26_OLEEU|nr:Hypothetical predicted protein [Olea europaea subsp. europaea]
MAFGDLAVVGMGKLGCSSRGRGGGGNLAVATEVILTPSLEMWEEGYFDAFYNLGKKVNLWLELRMKGKASG